MLWPWANQKLNTPKISSYFKYNRNSIGAADYACLQCRMVQSTTVQGSEQTTGTRCTGFIGRISVQAKCYGHEPVNAAHYACLDCGTVPSNTVQGI